MPVSLRHLRHRTLPAQPLPQPPDPATLVPTTARPAAARSHSLPPQLAPHCLRSHISPFPATPSVCVAPAGLPSTGRGRVDTRIPEKWARTFYLKKSFVQVQEGRMCGAHISTYSRFYTWYLLRVHLARLISLLDYKPKPHYTHPTLVFQFSFRVQPNRVCADAGRFRIICEGSWA